jgi:hypothetical protein
LQDGTQMAVWTLHNGALGPTFALTSLPAGFNPFSSKGLVA